MPPVRFEPTTSVFEQEKIFRASDRQCNQTLYIFMVGYLGVSNADDGSSEQDIKQKK
jgi:hypothetical protein